MNRKNEEPRLYAAVVDDDDTPWMLLCVARNYAAARRMVIEEIQGVSGSSFIECAQLLSMHLVRGAKPLLPEGAYLGADNTDDWLRLGYALVKDDDDPAHQCWEFDPCRADAQLDEAYAQHPELKPGAGLNRFEPL